MLYIIKNYQNKKISFVNELIDEANNTLIFINDAVLHLQHEIKIVQANVFALQDSVITLGIFLQTLPHIKLIDYQQWVVLTEQYAKIITL